MGALKGTIGTKQAMYEPGCLPVTEAAAVAALGRAYASVQAAEIREVVDGDRLRAMESLERRLVADSRWTAGPATLFGVLRLQHREVENCRVLAWLLDPLAPHGLGTQILTGFLELLEVAGTEEFDRSRIASASSQVEVAGDWSRADLVVSNQAWTIVVEAKIHAGEQTRQGARLEVDWPDATHVFLTPAGGTMSTVGEADWTPVTWTAVLDVVRRALLAPSITPSQPATATARRAIADFLIATGHLEHDDHG